MTTISYEQIKLKMNSKSYKIKIRPGISYYDFDNAECIGNGLYGKVFKIKSKEDSKYYLMKVLDFLIDKKSKVTNDKLFEESINKYFKEF